MFKDSSNPTKEFKEVETIIGQSVRVDGDFKSDGNVVVEGVVSGSITTQSNIRVGEQAEINANVEAVSAWVGGKIVGNLKIKDNLELAPTAKITGDINTGTIIVSKGAQINGCLKMGEPNQPSLLDNQASLNNQKQKNNNTNE